MNIYQAINALCDYACENKLIEKADRIFCINQIIDVLSMDAFEDIN